jgi:hypothetical protein
MPSLVRPEYGPSLPQVLGPRMARLPRPLRRALAAAGLAAMAIVAVLLIARPGGPRSYVQHAPVVFNLTWQGPPLRQAHPRAGELLRLEQRRGSQLLQSMTVEPLRLAPHGGDPSVPLPIQADALERQITRRFPGAAFGSEGRVRLNPDAAGYGFVFRAQLGARQLWGRGSLLAPADAKARLGVFILLLGTPEAGVHSTDQLGYVGPLKQPYRSFRFGTERP